MTVTVDLTELDWKIAHAIALDLVKEKADVNELSKAISYLRAYQNREEAGKKFFEYLTTLVRNGKKIGHSQKTVDYYQAIEKVCQRHLKTYPNNTSAMLQILGWATRLMRYYQNGEPLEQLPPENIYSTDTRSVQPESPPSIAPPISQKFVLEQIVEAKVINKKGNKVTYEIDSIIKLTQKETKHFNKLEIDQTVRVLIKNIKEDGKPNKIKLILS